MTFSEALEKMARGKKVCRLYWESGYVYRYGNTYVANTGFSYNFSGGDIHAEDWCLYKDSKKKNIKEA